MEQKELIETSLICTSDGLFPSVVIKDSRGVFVCQTVRVMHVDLCSAMQADISSQCERVLCVVQLLIKLPEA